MITVNTLTLINYDCVSKVRNVRLSDSKRFITIYVQESNIPKRYSLENWHNFTKDNLFSEPHLDVIEKTTTQFEEIA